MVKDEIYGPNELPAKFSNKAINGFCIIDES